jgi:DNA invertase Pin-like site-specific DNA recombinase
MRIGCARLSALNQNPELQLEKPRQAGCERIFVEKAARADRPELTRLLHAEFERALIRERAAAGRFLGDSALMRNS